MLGDYIPSLIRTYVPLLVASFVSWLAEVGVLLPDDASTQLATAVGLVAGALYYAGVRWAEQRWPFVGLLLGSTKQPAYTPPAATPFEGVADADLELLEDDPARAPGDGLPDVDELRQRPADPNDPLHPANQ